MLGELRYTSRSFYKVEVKILGGGYFNPSLCNLLHLAKWKSNLLTMAVLRYPVGIFAVPGNLQQFILLVKGYRFSRAFLDRAIFGPTSVFGEFEEFFSRPEYPY